MENNTETLKEMFYAFLSILTVVMTLTYLGVIF